MNYQKKIFLTIIILVVITAIIGSLAVVLRNYEIKKYKATLRLSETKKEQTQEKGKKGKEQKEFCEIPANHGSHIIKGDTVFCDNKGRMWSDTAAKGFTWDEAVSYCENLNYAGFDNWLLPGVEKRENFRESFVLYQLAQENCSWTGKKEKQEKCVPSWDPNANKSSAKYPYGYWTNFEELNHKKAWRIDFYNGNIRPASKDHIFSVRCVR